MKKTGSRGVKLFEESGEVESEQGLNIQQHESRRISPEPECNVESSSPLTSSPFSSWQLRSESPSGFRRAGSSPEKSARVTSPYSQWAQEKAEQAEGMLKEPWREKRREKLLTMQMRKSSSGVRQGRTAVIFSEYGAGMWVPEARAGRAAGGILTRGWSGQGLGGAAAETEAAAVATGRVRPPAAPPQVHHPAAHAWVPGSAGRAPHGGWAAQARDGEAGVSYGQAGLAGTEGGGFERGSATAGAGGGQGWRAEGRRGDAGKQGSRGGGQRRNPAERGECGQQQREKDGLGAGASALACARRLESPARPAVARRGSGSALLAPSPRWIALSLLFCQR